MDNRFAGYINVLVLVAVIVSAVMFACVVGLCRQYNAYHTIHPSDTSLKGWTYSKSHMSQLDVKSQLSTQFLASRQTWDSFLCLSLGLGPRLQLFGLVWRLLTWSAQRDWLIKLSLPATCVVFKTFVKRQNSFTIVYLLRDLELDQCKCSY